MKRSRLSRATGLKPKNPIGKVRKGTSVRSRKRAKERKEAGLVYGPYHMWIKTLPCALLGIRGHVCKSIAEGHHLTTVKNGGRDKGNEIPLCRDLHTATDVSVHMMGRNSFEAYWMIDMRQAAIALEIEYDEIEGYTNG